VNETPAGWQPTAREVREIDEWYATEPGLRQRLVNRRRVLARLEALGASEIILAHQRRAVREVEEILGI
jgi:hypothetical protein